MSVRQLVLESTFPSAPSTTRAVPTRLSAHGTVLAYGSGHSVVVRDLEKPSDVFLAGLHSVPVTAVRLSPTGRLVASGDQSGTVILWPRQSEPREILRSHELQGAVRDIAWTADEERLVIVGEGRTSFAVVITNTGNAIGVINGHTQNIISCDMRGERPFCLVTGGADSQVGLYEGVPFKFKCNIAGHTKSVTCVRYSPDMSTIATVSGSPDVILLDGLTGEKKTCLATGHTGTVYALAWSPDGSRIATASADKSVRVLDVTSGAPTITCAFGKSVLDMQQGIVYTASGELISVSLAGSLTRIAENGAVRDVLHGHQGRILLLYPCSDNSIISVGTDKALIWNGANSSLIPFAVESISAAAVGRCAGTHYVFVVSGATLWRAAAAANSQTAPEIVSGDAAAGTLAMAVTNAGDAVLLARSSATFVAQSGAGSTAHRVALDRFDGAAAAAAAEAVALGGDGAVHVYRLAPGAAPQLQLKFVGRHSGTVASLAISDDGARVASGDAGRNIFVWSAQDGAVLFADLVFHTLRVTSLAFAPNNSARLASGSVDASIIVWDLDSKRRKTQDAAHRGGVSAIAWGNDGLVVSGGSDCCVRRWKVD